MSIPARKRRLDDNDENSLASHNDITSVKVGSSSSSRGQPHKQARADEQPTIGAKNGEDACGELTYEEEYNRAGSVGGTPADQEGL